MSDTPTREMVTASGERLDDPFDPIANPEFFDGITMRRVMAYLVDLLIVLAASALTVSALVVVKVLSFGLLSPLFALLPIIPLAYHTAFVGGPNSATPGMRLFGIEVHRIEGDRPSYLQAAFLTAVFYVSIAFTSWLILLVALFNGRGRTFHDYLCGNISIIAPKRIEARTL